MKKGVVILGVTALVVIPWLLGVRVNLSPSAPTGIWLKTDPRHIQRGDFVFACANKADIRLGRDRGYLHWGFCAGGGEPLLKQVAGLPGDAVAVTYQVLINGEPWPDSLVRVTDGEGRLLDPVKDDLILDDGRYWLMSFHQPWGWDSRYLGAFRSEQIKGMAVPIWTSPKP